MLLLLLRHFSRVRLCVTPRRQPTRLPRPWDSPGKNTGVGCRFLLQCVKMKSESEVAQSCPTLSDPMDCSPPGSSVPGILQARILEWVVMDFCLNLPSFWRCWSQERSLINLLPGLPWWLRGKESACQCRRHGFDPWSGKIPHAVEQLSPSVCLSVAQSCSTLQPHKLQPTRLLGPWGFPGKDAGVGCQTAT